MRTQTLLVVIALVLIHIEDSLTCDHERVTLHYSCIFVIAILNLLSVILELAKA